MQYAMMLEGYNMLNCILKTLLKMQANIRWTKYYKTIFKCVSDYIVKKGKQKLKKLLESCTFKDRPLLL